jgi:hypothetical protein
MADPLAFASAFANGDGATPAAQECRWSGTGAERPPLDVSPLEQLPPEVNALLKDRLHSLDFAFTISDPTKVSGRTRSHQACRPSLPFEATPSFPSTLLPLRSADRLRS